MCRLNALRQEFSGVFDFQDLSPKPASLSDRNWSRGGYGDPQPRAQVSKASRAAIDWFPDLTPVLFILFAGKDTGEGLCT